MGLQELKRVNPFMIKGGEEERFEYMMRYGIDVDKIMIKRYDEFFEELILRLGEWVK